MTYGLWVSDSRWGLHIELAWTKPRGLWILFGAERLSWSGQEKMTRRDEALSSSEPRRNDHEGTSCFAHDPWSSRLRVSFGRTSPGRLAKLSGIDAIWNGFAPLLYEVSNAGTATDRSHAARWR